MSALKRLSIFPSPKKLGKRKWGTETLIALIPKKISLKILNFKKGKKGGLQYHRKKNECGYILKGKLLVRYVNEKNQIRSKICKKGDAFHITPGLIHQDEALTDCTIIEASTTHFNDRVRVEKKYGLKFTGGLKTTKLKDIKFR